MDKKEIAAILEDRRLFRHHIQAKLDPIAPNGLADIDAETLKRGSVVLFVISPCGNGPAEPCLILNKRSVRVRQAGDLCCPGGGVSWGLDRMLAHLLKVPGAPLRRWGNWPHWQKHFGKSSSPLSLLLAAGLREGWEEMRLNPIRFDYLGMLPRQQLVMFDRVIYPIVGWAAHHQLKPNWEVERIISIPIRRLLDPHRYGRFRPMVNGQQHDDDRQLRHDDYPCYIHEDDHGSEMLWGATFRIAQTFLDRVFDFSPPRHMELPLVHRYLDENYLNGSR